MKNEITQQKPFFEIQPLLVCLRKIYLHSLHFLSYQLEPSAYLGGLCLTTIQSIRKQISKYSATPVKDLTSVEPLTLRSSFKLLTEELQQCSAHVFRGQLAGLDARITAVRNNPRHAVGLLLMFIIAPAAYCVYYLFKGTPAIDGWFHFNLFHFFFLIRWQLFLLIGGLGFYHYAGQERKWKILAIPLGFVIMSLIVNIMADDNEEIWDIADFVLWGVGIAISLVIFYGLDYLIWKKYHRDDSFAARFETIENGIKKGVITDRQAVESFMTTMREKREFERKA
jgi:hypothetical protein